MPCRDGGPSIDEARVIPELKARLDRVTNLLCFLLSASPKLATRSEELMKWWEEHQACDRARRRKEREDEKVRVRARRERMRQLRDKMGELQNAMRLLEQEEAEHKNNKARRR